MTEAETETLQVLLENQKRIERKLNCVGMLLAGSKYKDQWGWGMYDLEGHSLS